MDHMVDTHQISDLAALEALYGAPAGAAVAKEIELPRSVILVSVDTVFFQCSRAIFRSRLWDPERHIDRASLPSLGRMLADISRSKFDAESYDRGLYERLKASLY